ncbi:hypothetical protein TNCV_4958131 [Trichonephila clavipes]|nr:hypothetical protein TNCV_4958131 [Trichonephila clavipes]
MTGTVPTPISGFHVHCMKRLGQITIPATSKEKRFYITRGLNGRDAFDLQRPKGKSRESIHQEASDTLEL